MSVCNEFVCANRVNFWYVSILVVGSKDVVNYPDVVLFAIIAIKVTLLVCHYHFTMSVCSEFVCANRVNVWYVSILVVGSKDVVNYPDVVLVAIAAIKVTMLVCQDKSSPFYYVCL